MKSVLMLFGAMTFIAGFALGVTEWAGDPTIAWWLPASWIVGGVVGSVPWFALASILSEVEALRADVKKLLQ
jgi:uncharacterized membrane protein